MKFVIHNVNEKQRKQSLERNRKYPDEKNRNQSDERQEPPTGVLTSFD